MKRNTTVAPPAHIHKKFIFIMYTDDKKLLKVFPPPWKFNIDLEKLKSIVK